MPRAIHHHVRPILPPHCSCQLPITATRSSSCPILPTKSTAPIHLRSRHLIGVAPIRCMANPRRVKMVAKQIQREISEMLNRDKVLQAAVLPEASLGADMYLSSVTSITDVEVSGDLQVAKVYVSIFGDERGRKVALAGLKSKAKYVRGQLGKRMRLRLTPEVRFIEDDSLERGSRVIAILDRLKAEREAAEGHDEQQSESSDLSDDEEDWEDDDPDEITIVSK